VLHAARWKYWTQNDAKNRHLRSIAQHCRAISSQLRHILTIGKKLVNQQYLLTCPYNMVNFGPLAAEIVSLVWGTPTNFNGFRILAALLHSQTVALNRGCHLYSAGRPSRWALAQISSIIIIIMAALHSRCKHYIFVLFLLGFFYRLISAVAGCMSAILPHVVWP